MSHATSHITRESAEVRALAGTDPLLDPLLERELVNRYLVWDAYVGGERRVDVRPLVLSRALHASAVKVAEGVARIVGQVAARAHDDAEERAGYGLHADVVRLAAASRRAGDDASLVRVDLLLDAHGAWQACEVNADCPGGHNEATGLPKLARTAGFHDGTSPGSVLDALAARLTALAHAPGDGPVEGEGVVGLVFATAYAEDLQVCALVQRALEARGTRAVLGSPTALRPFRASSPVLAMSGTPVRALYRFFPTEYMEGQTNLGAITDALDAGALRTLSSFAHMFAQSKHSFTRVHALAHTLDEADRAFVARHIPASVDIANVTADALRGEREAWVLKRALGRVGDEVFVGALEEPGAFARLVGEVHRLRALGEVWMAQRFVPQRSIPTPWGKRFVTLGAYVLDGRFCGYFARVTPVSHVSHEALCVPVFVDAES